MAKEEKFHVNSVDIEGLITKVWDRGSDVFARLAVYDEQAEELEPGKGGEGGHLCGGEDDGEVFEVKKFPSPGYCLYPRSGEMLNNDHGLALPRTAPSLSVCTMPDERHAYCLTRLIVLPFMLCAHPFLCASIYVLRTAFIRV